jgi:hypothetical protein
LTGILSVLIGAGLLLTGRKLFWLLVGAIGFLIGLEVATRIVFPSELVLIVSALALGLIFALMAVFLESVAIGVAGFLGGGLALMRVGDLLGLDANPIRIAAFIIGGILGAILVVWLFNWALIGISSVAGASMIVSGVFLRPADRPLLLLGLVILGLLIQGFVFLREGASPKSKSTAKK